MTPDDFDAAWQSDLESGEPVMKPPGPETATYRLAGGVTGADAVVGVDPPQPLRPQKRFSEDDSRRGKLVRRGSSRQEDFWILAGLNALVFVTSVCVMTLELTASRLIAKHVGSSLYTWTSVIGVVLAGITIGNFLGGWLADRYLLSRARSLSWLLLLASLTSGCVLWLDPLVAGMDRPSFVSWPMWVLTVVALIFAIPSLLLGTISPLAASMAIDRSQRTGLTVGNVYAWGAFGSIVGTFLTGFYLVDAFGTRSIIGLTSLILAAEAIAVSAGRWGFRTFVVFGWLQTLGLWILAATATGAALADTGTTVGKSFSWFATEETRAARVTSWETFGGNLGEKLHDLGLLMNLRDDQQGRYLDESNYSYIEVGDTYENGEPVKYLRLDKLVHSYYSPADPTALYYDYERIYAAITERVLGQEMVSAEASLAPFPDLQSLVDRLPAGISYDAEQQKLRAPEMTDQLSRQLRALSPEADWWDALDRLRGDSTRPNWGGFSTVALAELPDGVVLPDDLSNTIRFDESLGVLKVYDPLTGEVWKRLSKLGKHASYRDAVEQLTRSSQKMNAYFVGGGGFIFPRWVLENYPGSEHLHVAELDPAVLKAVIENFDYGIHEQSRIETRLGDARIDVQNRLRENAQRVQAGQAPILYDFIYGDAFNDFSIPWHLTTREFNEQLRELMSERGVLQANVIEIYPRTVLPAEEQKVREIDYRARIPEELRGGRESLPDGWVAAPQKFHPLEIWQRPNATSRLRITGNVPDGLEERLTALLPQDTDWQHTVQTLFTAARQPLAYAGTVPAELVPAFVRDDDWTPAPGEFETVELYQTPEGYAFGFRGAVSPELAERLKQLAPNDRPWQELIDEAVRKTHERGSGRFLGRYVETLRQVFPCLAVFSTSGPVPGDDRDTFVVVCSRQLLDLENLPDLEDLGNKPFASLQTDPKTGHVQISPHLASLIELSEGFPLTDDYAPVENLLLPVFQNQD